MPDNTGVNRNKDGTFKQGVSGNPNGRPKGSVAPSDILRQIASEFVNDESERTKLDFIMRMLFKMASNGNLQAIKEIIDRLEGNSTEKFGDVTEEWKELLFALNKSE